MDTGHYPTLQSQGTMMRGTMPINSLLNGTSGQTGSSGPSTDTTAVHTPVSSSGNTSSRHASGSDSPPTNVQLPPKVWTADNYTFPEGSNTVKSVTVSIRPHHEPNLAYPAATQPRYAGDLGGRDLPNHASSEGYRQHNLSSCRHWASSDGGASTLSHSRISSAGSHYQTSNMANSYHSQDLRGVACATGALQQDTHEDDVNRKVEEDMDSSRLPASLPALTGRLQRDPSEYAHATQYTTQTPPRGGELLPKVSNSPECSERGVPPTSVGQTLWPLPPRGNQESMLRLGQSEPNDHQPDQRTHTARPSDASLSSLSSLPSLRGAQGGEARGDAGGEVSAQDMEEDGPRPPFDPEEVPTEAICMWQENCNTDSALRKIISHVFGRNKLCTRQIPEPCWVHMCRKHYQRVRYRHTAGFAKIQVDLVLKQLDRLEAWSQQNQRLGLTAGILQSWTLGVRKREQKRVDNGDADSQDSPPSRKRAREEEDAGEDSAVEEGGSAPPGAWPPPKAGDEAQTTGDGKTVTVPTVSWQPPRKKGATAPNAVPKWLRDQCGTGYTTAQIRAIVRQLKVQADAGEIEQIPDIELLPTISIDQEDETSRQKYRRRNPSADLGVHGYAYQFDGLGRFGGPPLPMPGHNMYRPHSFGGSYNPNGFPFGGNHGTAHGPPGSDMYPCTPHMPVPQTWQQPANTYNVGHANGYSSSPGRTFDVPYSAAPAVSAPLWTPSMSSVENRAASETYHFGNHMQRLAPLTYQPRPAISDRPSSQSRAYGSAQWDTDRWRTSITSHARSQSDRLPSHHTSDVPYRSVEATAESTAAHDNHASSQQGPGQKEWSKDQLPDTLFGAVSQPESHQQTSAGTSWHVEQSRRYHDSQHDDTPTILAPMRFPTPAVQNSAQGGGSGQRHAAHVNESQYSTSAAQNSGQGDNSHQTYASYNNGTQNFEQGSNSDQPLAPYGNGTH